MIRILHVVHGMDCGGTENFIMNLYRNIDRARFQFDFLVHTQKHCYFDNEIMTLGGKIYHVPYYTILNLPTYKQALIQLFENHKEWAIVHGHLGSCACIYLKIAKKYGLYTIAHSHAINNKKITIKEVLYRIHTYSSRGVADFYMGCSYEAGLDRYGKKIASGNQFAVINNGIKADDYSFDEKKRTQIRKDLNVNNKYIIGHVGRFNAVKNHKFMVEILSELKKIRDDYMMMFVGDGELKESVRLQAASLGVEQSILFTGIRNDIPDVLQAMDQFIFPSFNEGLGIALIEAQASGLSCIANKDGIIPLAIITNIVEMKSVNEGAVAWAHCIDNTRLKELKRHNMSSIIKDAGFDIVGTTYLLQDFYLSKYNNI